MTTTVVINCDQCGKLFNAYSTYLEVDWHGRLKITEGPLHFCEQRCLVAWLAANGYRSTPGTAR